MKHISDGKYCSSQCVSSLHLNDDAEVKLFKNPWFLLFKPKWWNVTDVVFQTALILFQHTRGVFYGWLCSALLFLLRVRLIRASHRHTDKKVETGWLTVTQIDDEVGIFCALRFPKTKDEQASTPKGKAQISAKHDAALSAITQLEPGTSNRDAVSSSAA